MVPTKFHEDMNDNNGNQISAIFFTSLIGYGHKRPCRNRDHDGDDEQKYIYFNF